MSRRQVDRAVDDCCYTTYCFSFCRESKPVACGTRLAVAALLFFAVAVIGVGVVVAVAAAAAAAAALSSSSSSSLYFFFFRMFCILLRTREDFSLRSFSPPSLSNWPFAVYTIASDKLPGRNGMSGSARGGAEHLARIHGTEEDKVCIT